MIAYTDARAYGGAEIVLGHLLAELDPAIEVTVIGVDGGVVEAVAARRPGSGSAVVRAVRGKWDLASVAGHVRTFRKQAPDLVHVHLQDPWAGQYGILAAAIVRRPVIAAEQIVFPSTSRFQRRMRGWLDRLLAAHIAVGERAGYEIERMLDLPPESVEVIHNGVPDRSLNPVPPPAAEPMIGALARLEPQKGLDTLIRALPALSGSVNCVIVGDGPERSKLTGLASDLGVADRLTITGWTPRARDYLPHFDVLALPSRFEGFPLTIVEAMLARCPVVATPVQSVPEAVADGETGLLVPVDDHGSLAAAIQLLLDDAELRHRMGEEGRRRALSRFTAATMARQYERLYARVLG